MAGYCLTCGRGTSLVFIEKEDAPGVSGFFCNDVCREKKIEPVKPDGAIPSVKNAGIPHLKVKTEMTVEDHVRFDTLLASGDITAEGDAFLVSRKAQTKLEALNYAERFERLDHFDRLLARAFLEGMLDGIRTYRGQIGKLGTLYRKAHGLGTSLIKYIVDNA